MRQPELVDVLGGRALLDAADVPVHVDEAGQDVHPEASISFVAFCRTAASSIGDFRDCRRSISAMRLPSMTMSIGPIGGAPVPSMIVAPRMISRLNGPSPSPGVRSGAGVTER